MTYIYCLKDSEQVYYVGRTNNVQKRKYQHIRKSFEKADIKDIIIQRQIKEFGDIELHILEQCEELAANETEIKWIREMVKRGYLLNNVAHNKVFSKGELKLLVAVANGYTSKEIAAIRGRSIKTIEAIRYNMMRKANCKSFPQLVYWATKQGLI